MDVAIKEEILHSNNNFTPHNTPIVLIERRGKAIRTRTSAHFETKTSNFNLRGEGSQSKQRYHPQIKKLK